MERIDALSFYEHMMTEIEVLQTLEPDPVTILGFACIIAEKAGKALGWTFAETVDAMKFSNEHVKKEERRLVCVKR